MLIWTEARLVFLAQTKCASTAIEAELRDGATFTPGPAPEDKHTSFLRYDRVYRACFEGIAGAPLEVVSLMREPEEWLSSWWRYRRRPALLGHPSSTAEMTFEEFVGDHLDGAPGPSDVGSQAAFLEDGTGGIGPNLLFRYEDLGEFLDYVGRRLNQPVRPRWRNVAPRIDAHLSRGLRQRLHAERARDFSIHASIAAHPPLRKIG